MDFAAVPNFVIAIGKGNGGGKARFTITPDDDDADEIDETVTLTASGTGAIGVADVALAAANEPTLAIADDDEPNTAPSFNAGDDTTRSVPENSETGTKVGAALAVTDPEDDSLTYSLTGTGAGNFAIDGSGQITVSNTASLDHETTESYIITVSVHDGKDAASAISTDVDDSITVTISVTDANEDGDVSFNSAAPQVSAALTANITDPDGSVSSVSWQWSSSTTQGGTFTAITGATSASYTPVANDVNKWLKATANYTDGHGRARASKVADAAVAGCAGSVATPKRVFAKSLCTCDSPFPLDGGRLGWG